MVIIEQDGREIEMRPDGSTVTTEPDTGTVIEEYTSGDIHKTVKQASPFTNIFHWDSHILDFSVGWDYCVAQS